MSFARTIVLIVLVTLLAASCRNLPVIPSTPVTDNSLPVFTYNRSMEAFEFSASCPNGCFLGIKPLVTTAVEALHILQHSPDINHSEIYILYDNGNKLAENITDSSLNLLENGGTLEAPWGPTNDKQWGFDMYIGATNGIVDNISAQPIDKTIGNFNHVLGEPDKIKVYSFMPPDNPYEICYWLYYSKWKVEIYNLCGGTIDGPKPSDWVYYVILNAEIKDAEYNPWHGYGKMPLYMSPEQLQDYERYTGNHPNIVP